MISPGTASYLVSTSLLCCHCSWVPRPLCTDQNAVFLRTLEYYSGILFLTSNREGLIDEAFKSRIHIALRYKRIDRDGTQQIWKNILNRIQQDNLEEKKKIKIEFIEDKLLEWAAKHFKEHDDPDRTATWNGRQIRNAFQSAIALASYDRLNALHKKGISEEQAMEKAQFRRVVLKPKHFSDVAKVVQDFEDYCKCQSHACDAKMMEDSNILASQWRIAEIRTISAQRTKVYA